MHHPGLATRTSLGRFAGVEELRRDNRPRAFVAPQAALCSTLCYRPASPAQDPARLQLIDRPTVHDLRLAGNYLEVRPLPPAHFGLRPNSACPHPGALVRFSAPWLSAHLLPA